MQLFRATYSGMARYLPIVCGFIDRRLSLSLPQ